MEQSSVTKECEEIMIKTGDLVQLKSGGPVMTVVEKVPVSEYWICSWFTRKGKLQSGRFLLNILIVCEPGKDSSYYTSRQYTCHDGEERCSARLTSYLNPIRCTLPKEHQGKHLTSNDVEF